ncbi:hypothetical protein [Hymenobacter rubripertinctus]|uniref:Uncharacterized protein n=1 Tax=Hymenobacter rubripertinctus TaxID=2029981 RepID=A0A418R5Q1_9BACT|nr:hypothetical protein [Hymenobacter rubripertinctus]RIY12838.1 hypothetical protein D0T11_03700 [Hymenobacter rubripertinctus]
MPFPVQLLTTQAECDTALAALSLELRVFSVRDQVLDLQADQSAGRATNRAQDLAAATASITSLTPVLATLTPGTTDYAAMNKLLLRAQRRGEDLSATASAQTPTEAFLKAVDVRQVAVQVPELELAIAEVTARRAAL